MIFFSEIVRPRDGATVVNWKQICEVLSRVEEKGQFYGQVSIVQWLQRDMV